MKVESECVQNILHAIVETSFNTRITKDAPLVDQLAIDDWSQRLCSVLVQEIGPVVNSQEIIGAGSLLDLAILVESRLPKNPMGQTVVDIYRLVEDLARDEIDARINYHWNACWEDFFRAGLADSLDDVEFVMRLEEEFGFAIPDEDAQAMRSIGQTVRYIWSRSCTQGFFLRRGPESICRGSFIFNEIRRLIIVRGGIPRNAGRLDACLKELLPHWYMEFWHQVQDVFQIELPQGCLWAFGSRLEGQVTVRELVHLILSKQKQQKNG